MELWWIEGVSLKVERVRSFADVDEEVYLWDCDVIRTWVRSLIDDVSFIEVPEIVVWTAFVCESTLFLFPDWFLKLCEGIGNDRWRMSTSIHKLITYLRWT